MSTATQLPVIILPLTKNKSTCIRSKSVSFIRGDNPLQKMPTCFNAASIIQKNNSTMALNFADKKKGSMGDI
jgi:hypothetical protein